MVHRRLEGLALGEQQPCQLWLRGLVRDRRLLLNGPLLMLAACGALLKRWLGITIDTMRPQGFRFPFLDRLEIAIPVIASSAHRVFADPALLKIFKVIILWCRNSAIGAFP